MLITDHADEYSYDDLISNTEGYRDSDPELMNVIMTANWIVGRDSEKMSEDEKENPAFFIPASAALAGKLYDESANMAQGAGGKKYGTLDGVKGVHLDLLKSEIASLMDNRGYTYGILRRPRNGIQQHHTLQRRQHCHEGVPYRSRFRLGKKGADELRARSGTRKLGYIQLSKEPESKDSGVPQRLQRLRQPLPTTRSRNHHRTL